MEVLLTDVTEFKYGKSSKAYLSAILDYGANKIVAFKLSIHNNNALVRDTVEQIETAIVPTQTLLHSDCGFQYTSHGFNKFIKKHQITQSMSRVGDTSTMGLWKIFGDHQRRDVSFEDLQELRGIRE